MKIQIGIKNGNKKIEITEIILIKIVREKCK